MKDEWHNQLNETFPSLYRYLDAVGEIGSRSAKYYLIYMAVRLIEMHRVLKPMGSVYLHCDPTASHYLKLLMDTIFGHKHFRNEIAWYYKNASRGKKRFASAHDVILWYSKSEQYTFNREEVLVPFESGMTEWRYSKGGQAGKPKPRGKTPDDVVDMPSLNAMSRERTGYPTQKPLSLLQLIVRASSSKGDMVLDPFCGCATTCVAAEGLDREWIGIDVSRKAYDLVKMRLDKKVMSLYGHPILREDGPTRTDLPHKPKPTREDKDYLYGKQGGDCAGCRTHFEKRHLEIDHIVPVSKGGNHERDNLQLLCGSCNRMKGDRPMEYLRSRQKAYLLAA